MLKTKTKLTDMMSEEKSKKMEKLAEKLLKFCRENDLYRFSITFLSQDIRPHEEDKRYGNYINIHVNDRKENELLDLCMWEERS